MSDRSKKLYDMTEEELDEWFAKQSDDYRNGFIDGWRKGFREADETCLKAAKAAGL